MTTPDAAETSPIVIARFAGLLYLIIIVCGISSEVAVRGSLVVPGDAAATAANIMAAEGFFRLGFLGDSLVFLSDAALAVLLYVLLAPAGKTLALIAAALRLTQTAILGVNLLNHYAPLIILDGGGAFSSFDADQLNALALLALEFHGHGYDLALIFFGVSCLVIGWLLVKSDSFPAILGWLVAAAGLVYLIGSYTRFLFPAYVDAVAPIYIVALVGELALCLWLLVMGVRAPA